LKWSIQIAGKIHNQKSYSVANFCDILEYDGMEYRKNTDDYPYGVMLHKFSEKVDKITLEFDSGKIIEIFPDCNEIVCCEAQHICGSSLEARFIIGTMAKTLVLEKE